MPKRKLSGLAQDVRLAREMGLTYGALKAPPVYVRGYAGELYPRDLRAPEGRRRRAEACAETGQAAVKAPALHRLQRGAERAAAGTVLQPGLCRRMAAAAAAGATLYRLQRGAERPTGTVLQPGLCRRMAAAAAAASAALRRLRKAAVRQAA